MLMAAKIYIHSSRNQIKHSYWNSIQLEQGTKINIMNKFIKTIKLFYSQAPKSKQLKV